MIQEPGQRTRIFLCPNPSLNGMLMLQAAAELAGANLAETVSLTDLQANPTPGPLLVLDGDAGQAGRLLLEENTIAFDFHLVLSDLGLECSSSAPVNAHDLQLVKDAIEAVCTVTDGPTPKFNCPCSGG